jgi:hypothetical protein
MEFQVFRRDRILEGGIVISCCEAWVKPELICIHLLIVSSTVRDLGPV